MGGDQVYPDPGRDEYQNRLTGPYRAALPYVADNPPDLYAIPGNHDWYDGLTSFTRLFCQAGESEETARWIGGWRTRQRRSYFSLKLPHGWYVWGTDVQLSSDVDKMQLDYFHAIARKMVRECGGETPKVILVTAEPNWVYSGVQDPGDPPALSDAERYRTLAFFEDKVIRAHGLHLALVLAGDLHHYCRYQQQEADGAATHRITSGGGGAYLFATHQMPHRLELPERHRNGKREVSYRREAVFPSEETSVRLARKVWGLPWRNFSFSLFLGSIYLLFAWMVESASAASNKMESYLENKASSPGGTAPEVVHSLVDSLQGLSAGETLYRFAQVLAHSPASVLLLVAVVFGLYKFSAGQGEAHGRLLRWLGLAHGLAHVLLAVAAIYLFAQINGWLARQIDWLDPTGDPGFILQMALFSVEMLILGGTLGSVLFAAFLVAASRWSCAHTNEIFSSQRIPDFKSFLRFHIGSDGKLVLHPLGVERVPRRWRLDTTARGGAPWFLAEDREIVCRQVEEPVEIG